MVYWQTLFCYSLPICNTTRHVRTRRPLSARTRNWFLLVPRFLLSMIFSNTLRRLELHSSESTANFFTKKYFWVELDAPEARKQFLRCLRVAGPMLTVQSNGSLGYTLCVHVHFLFSLLRRSFCAKFVHVAARHFFLAACLRAECFQRNMRGNCIIECWTWYVFDWLATRFDENFNQLNYWMFYHHAKAFIEL